MGTATGNEDFLLGLLQAMAELAAEPLYPAPFAQARGLDREKLDRGLDELRRLGLVRFTDWVKDLGQGCTLTDAGRQALTSKRLSKAVALEPPTELTGLSDLERGDLVRRAIFLPQPPVVARVLLIANLLYFAFGAAYAVQHDLELNEYLLGEGATTTAVLKALGALRPSLVFPDQRVLDNRPQYERIVLACFLHIGLLHLFMNMYFLGSFAPHIEGMWGHARFLAIYLVSGIVSGCVVLLLAQSDHRPGGEGPITAGASGCLFGIFVAMLVWFWFNYTYLPDGLVQAWKRNTVINVVLLLAINFFPGISWQGHFGGAVGGLLAGLFLHANRFHPSPIVRWLALGGVAAIPLGFFVAVLWQAGRL
ncbi:MAG: rhomboid family intramembrane serine protease [Planctomycetes bacterium]|jgi:membrane associated rhomboid family serine protease|nr:rhomboid family intramembrane serine protease [Planctomycetota bacterium]